MEAKRTLVIGSKRSMITFTTKENSMARQKSLFLNYISIEISFKDDDCNMQLGVLSLINPVKGVPSVSDITNFSVGLCTPAFFSYMWTYIEIVCSLDYEITL